MFNVNYYQRGNIGGVKCVELTTHELHPVYMRVDTTCSNMWDASLSSKRVRATELGRSLKVTDASSKVDTKSDNSISVHSMMSIADEVDCRFWSWHPSEILFFAQFTPVICWRRIVSEDSVYTTLCVIARIS